MLPYVEVEGTVNRGEPSLDIQYDAADWFVRVWNGDIEDDHDVARFMPDYPNWSCIPSESFDFLERDDRPS